MATVKFWTPVTYEPFVPPSWGQSLLEKVDGYFCRDGKKVCVVPGNEQGKSEGVVAFNGAPYKTALKTASYCTLIIPALVFIAKVILRSIYQFHIIETKRTPYLGEGVKSSTPPAVLADPTPPLLEVMKKYRFTAEKTAALRIKIPNQDRGHDLPQKDTEAYRCPPSVLVGVSELPVYARSTFEVEYKGHYSTATDTMEDMHYEVTRREGASILWPYGNKKVELTLEQVIDLKIIPVGEGLGVSIREEFKDFFFSYKYNERKSTYSIVKMAISRTVPLIPLNAGVPLKPELIQQYQLTPIGEFFAEKWGIFTSALPEYQDSVFLVSEASGKLVRMFKRL